MPSVLATGSGRIGLIGAAAFASLLALVTANLVHENQLRDSTARTVTGGDPARAPAIFRRYGCSGCHTIPGIAGADGQTGAPLTELAKRVYIAGVLENRSDNLVAWIISPEKFSPQTAMPNTGISEHEARDLAAYLYAQ
jgi:cytochrome c1